MGGLTIERVCLLMNIVPWKAINLAGQTSQHITEHSRKKGSFTDLC